MTDIKVSRVPCLHARHVTEQNVFTEKDTAVDQTVKYVNSNFTWIQCF